MLRVGNCPIQLDQTEVIKVHVLFLDKPVTEVGQSKTCEGENREDLDGDQAEVVMSGITHLIEIAVHKGGR